MINPRFAKYFEENFFSEKPEEFQQFLWCINDPLPRTIRIKPEKNSTKKRLENDGWILETTDIPRVFRTQRSDDFKPFDRRIGMSLDHLMGNFYIQELAAAHPVNLLAEGKIHKDAFLILDMASSPGGKTTQLSEYFPKSFLIANEPNRERIPQLLQNLERMHSPNVAVTLYPGQQWKRFGEIFDRILLDAPCSGEWTLFKGTDAVKNWHIKSIKNIANLQKKLIESALFSLKVGGEMVYSTCSLNNLENEEILSHIRKKFGEKITIQCEKKFWPHIDKTGGFFMAKILKNSSIIPEKTLTKNKNSNDEIKKNQKKIPWETRDGISLFEHRDKILAVKNAEIITPHLDKMYFMRLGETIGHRNNGEFFPNARSYRDIFTENFPEIILKNDEELDRYLRGESIYSHEKSDYVNVKFDNEIIAFEKNNNGLIANTFPKDWRRK